MDLKILQILVIIILLNVFYCNNKVFAQFSMSAEIRPRFECRNGYGKLPTINDKPAYFISQRSRFNLHYKNSKVRYALALQDVRVWGDDTIYKATGVHGSEASIDLHQAYFEWLFSKKSSFRIGRQVFAYDDERLLSTRNWNQHGIAYNALLLKTQLEEWNVHLGLSLNNKKENKFGNYYEQEKMKTLNFLHLRRSIKDIGYFSLVAIATGYTASDSSEVIYMRGTIGGYLFLNTPPFNYSLSGYFQFGKNKYSIPVQAYLWTSGMQWESKQLTARAGIDYISGNAECRSGNINRQFDLLYGSRHRYYGTMDYFSDFSKATNSRGLTDVWLSTSYEVLFNTSIRADFHRFTLQDNRSIIKSIADGSNIFGNYMGTELDFTIEHKLLPCLRLYAGYSFFNPSDYMRTMQSVRLSDRMPQWAWMMLDFRLTLFETD